ncbi:NB-ARC domains-containing protein, partial [Tanacetum coccineum]
VFEFMRKEAWYEADHSLYGDLMLMFGKKKLIDRVEKLFAELMSEGLEPDTRVYTELIGAYLKVEMIDKAMETYELMKASGCIPDELTLMIMIRNLESAGRDDLTAIIKNDCVKYLDSPKKFLKEVARKFCTVSFLSSSALILIMLSSIYPAKETETESGLKSSSRIQSWIYFHLFGVAMVSTLVKAVLQKLADETVKQVVRVHGIRSEVKNLEKTLSSIQALLVDATDKDIKEFLVQNWLSDLQHVAYDIDDILDDLATDAMHPEFTTNSGANTSKVRKLISSCYTNFSLCARTYHKLDDINHKLQDLEKDKKNLGLMVKNGRLEVKDDRSKDKNRKSQTSLVDASRIVGRPGKTTLARLLYNNEEVNNHFKLKAWVCVSDEWDSFGISNIIFQSVTRKTGKFKDLNLLQIALRDILVLDDVWSERIDDWESLVAPFKACARGSKIILTTRKEQLLRELGCGKFRQLQSLSHDDAVCLSAHHALGANNFNSHPRLKAHGEGIVRKCDGLPLALIALGRLMMKKKWKDMLESEIWRLQEGGGVVPALRLSYHELPAYLKKLFAYCSLFPKDYLFDKEDLVLLWMQKDFCTKFEKEMEKNVTKQALDKCRHVSFVYEQYEANKKFKVFKRAKGLRTFLVISLTGYAISEVPESIGSLKHLRYLNLAQTEIKCLPQNVCDLYNLETLIVFGCYRLTKLPNNFFNLKNLRHLDIRDTPLLRDMPLGVGELKSLQTLSKIVIGGENDISITQLKDLKDLQGRISIEGLSNVQNAVEACEAKLSERRFTYFEVDWSYVGYRKETTEKEVLDALKPYNNGLKKLGIVNYIGLEFPKWVGDPSLCHLVSVSLLSTISGSGDGDAVFPCLKELSLTCCPNLVEVSLEALPSLDCVLKLSK